MENSTLFSNHDNKFIMGGKKNNVMSVLAGSIQADEQVIHI